MMRITFDPAKRDLTITQRGIDFASSAQVFEGAVLTLEDDRRDYGEIRFQTYGSLDGRIVMIVWTERHDARHVISMRFCHDKEARKVRDRLGRS